MMMLTTTSTKSEREREREREVGCRFLRIYAEKLPTAVNYGVEHIWRERERVGRGGEDGVELERRVVVRFPGNW